MPYFFGKGWKVDNYYQIYKTYFRPSIPVFQQRNEFESGSFDNFLSKRMGNLLNFQKSLLVYIHTEIIRYKIDKKKYGFKIYNFSPKIHEASVA